MDKRKQRNEIQRALNSTLSGLRDDPFLAQRVIAQAKKGKRVKKKISAGLVIALVLLLATATATAAILLSMRQIVDEQAVPMANAYQGESYTVEDTNILLRLAEENGVELSQRTKDEIAKASARGEGYYKEELIMAMAKAEFGDDPATWSLEEQKWFDDVCLAIGFVDAPQKALPSGEEITEEQAIKIAEDYLSEHYHPQSLNDPLIYRRGVQYLNGFTDGEYPAKYWSIFYDPLTIDASAYVIYVDSNGEVLNAKETPGISLDVETSVDMRADEILSVYESVYHGAHKWDQSILRAFREDVMRSTDTESRAYLCLAQTSYPDYPPNAISKQEARDLMITQLGFDPAQCNTHVFLIGDSPNPVLKVSLYNTSDGRSWSCEIDSMTGEVKDIRELDNLHLKWWMRIVLWDVSDQVDEEWVETPSPSAG